MVGRQTLKKPVSPEILFPFGKNKGKFAPLPIHEQGPPGVFSTDSHLGVLVLLKGLSALQYLSYQPLVASSWISRAAELLRNSPAWQEGL